METASRPFSCKHARAASRTCSRRASRRSSVIRGMAPLYHQIEGTFILDRRGTAAPALKRTFLQDRRLAMTTTTPLAGRAASDADYERLGLSRDTIAPWEDGARTDGGRGSFEWWYFDAHLDDGTALVVVFQTKDFTDPQKPLTPLVRINLDLPDGRSLQKSQRFAPEGYSAATDHADVRIAGNRFEGDLHRYRITAAIAEVSVDLTPTGKDPT